MNKPLIAVPAGDPAGIGPEIVVKAAAEGSASQAANIVVIGNRSIMEQAVRITGTNLKVHLINRPAEGIFEPKTLNLISMNNVDMGLFAFGKVSSMCGHAAYDYIAESIRLALKGEVDAVATTPINKESLHAAHVPFIGHTEIFGSLTHTKDPLTMFETKGLRIFFLTRHLSLREAIEQIREEQIVSCAKSCFKALARLGITEGEMAVAGLNPHWQRAWFLGNEKE